MTIFNLTNLEVKRIISLISGFNILIWDNKGDENEG
jgi:hypothetical protein